MSLYQCKLIDNKGYFSENFFREGESAEDVLKELQNFQYGDGEWVIYLDGKFEISGTT